MPHVLLIDKDKRPLTPVHPAQARHLLFTHQAVVFCPYPFTIILKRKVPTTTLAVLGVENTLPKQR